MDEARLKEIEDLLMDPFNVQLLWEPAKELLTEVRRLREENNKLCSMVKRFLSKPKLICERCGIGYPVEMSVKQPPFICLPCLTGEVRELHSMLTRLEWYEWRDDPKYDITGVARLCPVCDRMKGEGHDPDCELAALISE